jgi:hypothetical protein
MLIPSFKTVSVTGSGSASTGLALVALSTQLLAAYADTDYSCAHANSWFLNEDDHTDTYYSVKTDVTSSSLVSGEWRVTTNRIPKYDHVMTADDMTFLNNRPEASSDYTTGATTVSEGDTVLFGEDIGYANTAQGCDMGMYDVTMFFMFNTTQPYVCV